MENRQNLNAPDRSLRLFDDIFILKSVLITKGLMNDEEKGPKALIERYP